MSPKPTLSRALLAFVLAMLCGLYDRFASDVSGSVLSNIIKQRISPARACVKVLQSFSSKVFGARTALLGHRGNLGGFARKLAGLNCRVSH